MFKKGETSSFDPIWEDKYRGGHSQRYPWDAIVSFVFRNAPRDRKREEVSILEVGCGTASNLHFAASEGFSVSGVDASPSAISQARDWFSRDQLKGVLEVGDFTALSFVDNSFDLAIDRAAITCCGELAGQKAIDEVWRVLRPGGRFHFNPYSTSHRSFASGTEGPDKVRLNIDRGSLAGFGQLYFYDFKRIQNVFARKWKLLGVDHVQMINELDPEKSVHAEWRVVAEKIAP